MNRDRFFGMKVCQPAKTKSQRPARLFWFLQVLMRTLQGDDGKIFRGQALSFTHHLTLARTVAMERNQQWSQRLLRKVKIVIEFDFSPERSFNRGRLWRDLSFHRHAYSTRSYRTASDSEVWVRSRPDCLAQHGAPAVGTTAYPGRLLCIQI